MRERDYKDAMAGDKAAAARVVMDAMRRDDWSTAAAVVSAVAQANTQAMNPAQTQSARVYLRAGYTHFEGDLDVSTPGEEYLPEGLYVGGKLKVGRVRKIPDSLRAVSLTSVGGLLNEIGDDVHIADRMYVCRSPLRKIGRNLYVGGDVSLYGMLSLTIPSTTVFCGYFNARDSSHLTLEPGVRLEGGADFVDCRHLSLPEGLRVGGDLKLDWAASIPRGLRVGGDLVIRGFQGLARSLVIPEDLVVGGCLRVPAAISVPQSVVARGGVDRR